MEYMSANDSSRLLKKALVKAFPGTKFSVRLSTGTAYGNANIRWTDGPSSEAVQEIANAFEGMGFDGMTDSSYLRKTDIDGKKSGLGLILLHRGISDARMAEAEERIKSEGWSGGSVSMACAARMVAFGASILDAIQYHHLTRS